MYLANAGLRTACLALRKGRGVAALRYTLRPMSALRIKRMWRVSLLLVVVASTGVARAETLTVAVASNFTTTLKAVATAFEAGSEHRLRISSASTGKLYAQIVNGAPFDVFLAADVSHPRLLEANGIALADTRFTYATGRLALWSRRAATDCSTWLTESDDGKLAIANPLHAPYGVAARETLESLDVWGRFTERLVVGENIAQTLQFAASGNAGAALVAVAQLRLDELPEDGCSWRVPADLHAPIEQQAVVLARARDNNAARDFHAFLQSDEARELIERSGYAVQDR